MSICGLAVVVLVSAVVLVLAAPMVCQAARGEVPSVKEVKEIGDRVADWRLSHPRHADREDNTRGWVMGTFYIGLAEYAAATDQERYFRRLRDIAEKNEWRMGRHERLAEDQTVGYCYGQLFKRYGDAKMLGPMREQFDRLSKLPYDESLEWTDKIRFREWAWCDALFMGPPTLFQLSEITGDPKYADQADRLWWKSSDYLFDKDEKLFYRDSRYFTQKEASGRPIFWSRGNGWVVAGLPRIIEALPKDDPRRQKYEAQFRQMMERLVALQKPDGYWPAGLLDAKTWNEPETSGTAFFTYGLLWGINHGVLNREAYLTPALKGWDALVAAVEPSGKLGWVQPVGEKSGPSKQELSEPYATGGFLLAASELYEMARGQGEQR
jgi:unsaturated rhamnogalacturonyl hydrolase